MIDNCPDAQWRLLFALSRFGGLRCPSEHLGLRWGDVDWERKRIMVHSPRRPIILTAVFVRCRSFPSYSRTSIKFGTKPSGIWSTSITPLSGAKRICERSYREIIKRSGLDAVAEAVAKPSIHEGDGVGQRRMAGIQGVRQVARSHKKLVAEKHYWQVTDADFDLAATIPCGKAAQIRRISCAICGAQTRSALRSANRPLTRPRNAQSLGYPKACVT